MTSFIALFRAMLHRNFLVPAVALCAVVVYSSHHWWVPAIARTLVCEESAQKAQTIVLDNLDKEYGLFKWGAEFQRAGARVLVPVPAAQDRDAVLAAEDIAAAFARVAGLTHWDMIPVREQEPISLHTARRVREFLTAQQISSVTLVSNGFRSKRSAMIYRSVLAEHGISMTCLPVFGTITPSNWTGTWHGIQDVALHFLKLQYYRFWVLPWMPE